MPGVSWSAAAPLGTEATSPSGLAGVGWHTQEGPMFNWKNHARYSVPASLLLWVGIVSLFR